MNKLQRTDLIFLAGITLTPFFYWPSAVIAYEVPKVWLIIGWIMLLALVSIFTQRKVKQSPHSQPLLFAVVAFFIISTVASLLGADFAKSVVGNPYRIDGLITLSSLIAFALLLKTQLTTKLHFPFMLALWISSATLSIWASGSYFLLHALGQSVPNWYGSIGLNFGQPNFLAGYLLTTLPLYFYLYPNKRLRPLLIVTFLFQCLAIAATFSWAAGAGIVLFFLLLAAKKYLHFWRHIWIGLLVVFITTFISLSFYKKEESFVAESRSRIYTRVFEGFLQRPLLGWGIANVDHAFTFAAKKDAFEHDVYLDKAHSEALEVATTTGIIGLSTYLFMIIILWKKLSSAHTSDPKWKESLLMMLILYLFHSQTNVISISQSLIFWLIVADALNFKQK